MRKKKLGRAGGAARTPMIEGQAVPLCMLKPEWQ